MLKTPKRTIFTDTLSKKGVKFKYIQIKVNQFIFWQACHYTYGFSGCFMTEKIIVKISA